MIFYKMQGLGNDYIYIDCTKGEPERPEELAVRLSDRHFGVGGDGLVLICASDKADFRMRMFNADGSEGKMCGNASRCIAKFVYEKGLSSKEEITLETLSGLKRLKLFVSDGKVTQVRVDMGEPVLEGPLIPSSFKEDRVILRPLKVGREEYKITALSVGNPHCVVFLKEPAALLKLEEIGPLFERHESFPERVNTEFVNVTGENSLEMRVYERGSGETLACGTGACAAAVAAVLCGYAKRDEEISVSLPGGVLKIIYTSENRIYMTGPASFIFKGELCD